MKNCPKCKVDFDDSFSFCEFDGMPLEKVFLSGASDNRARGFAVAVRVIGILILVLTTILIIGKGSRKTTQVVANQKQSSSVEQPIFVETPQGAQDYGESVEESKTSDEPQQGDSPKKPGVEVYKPDTKESRDANPSKSQPAHEAKSPEAQASTSSVPSTPKPAANPTPNPTKTRIGERTPISSRGEGRPKTSEQGEQSREERRESTSQQTVTRAPQPEATRPRTVTESIPQQPSASTVSLNLIRIRSYRTDSGMRYEMTFTMRENGNGRMIRWERLSLVSRSASGVTHAEAVPFHQRLGGGGAMTFTVSKEMRGRSEGDFQGQISCTGIGTDIEGRQVRSTFTARVNP